MSNTSGQYFLDDGRDIRIGCAEDVLERLRQHQSSNRLIKLIGIVPTHPKEIFDEEKVAFNYFERYKIRKSFYSREILPKIPFYIQDRILERNDLLDNIVKRTGTIQTLWGEESLTSIRERCDIFPNQFVTIMGRAGTKAGERPRKFVIEGKTYHVSERAKNLIQSIIRDTKEKHGIVWV